MVKYCSLLNRLKTGKPKNKIRILLECGISILRGEKLHTFQYKNIRNNLPQLWQEFRWCFSLKWVLERCVQVWLPAAPLTGNAEQRGTIVSVSATHLENPSFIQLKSNANLILPLGLLSLPNSLLSDLWVFYINTIGKLAEQVKCTWSRFYTLVVFQNVCL